MLQFCVSVEPKFVLDQRMAGMFQLSLLCWSFVALILISFNRFSLAYYKPGRNLSRRVKHENTL